MSKKILIISHDKVGTNMAGPGIRYHYMAETLSHHFDVTLGFFGPENVPDSEFIRSYKTQHIDVHQFHKAFANIDVVIALWVTDAIIEFCNKNNILLIFDIYAPVPVENLAVKIFSGKSINDEDDFTYMSQIRDYQKFLENGDAFLYSNERQLDYWLGFAFGAGQISPTTYLKRPLMEQFIHAPMGIDTSLDLSGGKPHYKGVLGGVAKNDIVMIWNGGIYDWYDGTTLVKAMAKIAKSNPLIKLIFPGTQHPTATMREWQETTKTIDLAKSLKLIDKNIFFFDSWIPYHERINFLSEADIGIYTHKISIETEFSHRTRVIDGHILASLPTIATQGDYFAELVEKEDLGKTVPPYDVDKLAEAITELAKPANLARARKNMERIRTQFDWRYTLEPLITYLKSSPKKTIRLSPLNKSPAGLKKSHLTHIKRLTPKPIKKTVIKLAPRRLKHRLVGK